MDYKLNAACNEILKQLLPLQNKYAGIEQFFSEDQRKMKSHMEAIYKKLFSDKYIDNEGSGFGDNTYSIRINYAGINFINSGGYPTEPPSNTRIGFKP